MFAKPAADVGISLGRGQQQARRGGKREKVQALTQQQDTENVEDDAFYVFTATTGEGLESLELRINNKLVDVIVDSGSSCNLMSEDLFHFITRGETTLAECDRSVC